MRATNMIEGAIPVSNGIVQLSRAFMAAKVLLSAVELGVFTVLADGPLDLETLRNKIGIDQRGAGDFFDALVALALLERDPSGRYANTREVDYYLDRNKPAYMGGELDHLNGRVYSHWYLLTTALRTGKPQSGATAPGDYPLLYANPTTLEGFVKGMAGGSLQAATAMAAKFPWQNYKTFIDVGTAQGCLPVQIARAHHHIAGGGFDLPPVRPVFERYVDEHHLSGRLRFHPGDFFQGNFPAADVLVMGRVLHNWDLAAKKMLLAKAFRALPAAGALIVYERLIDDERRVNAAGLLASLNMLVMTPGGFDFTAADCIGWMREAGFHDMRVEALTDDQSMIVGTK